MFGRSTKNFNGNFSRNEDNAKGKPVRVKHEPGNLESRMHKNGISSRIKDLIGNETVSSFARRCGISESLLRRYISGSTPGSDKAILIAQAAGVTLDWLATGEGTKGKIDAAQVSCAIMNGDQEEGLAILSCKERIDEDIFRNNRHEVTLVEALQFNQNWLLSELNVSPSDVCLLTVESENMEPTFRRGDIILVDHRDTGPSGDGVYVLKMDEALLIKRLQRKLGGVISVTNDNVTYSSFEIDKQQMSSGHFTVMGRVIWVGRRI